MKAFRVLRGRRRLRRLGTLIMIVAALGWGGRVFEHTRTPAISQGQLELASASSQSNGDDGDHGDGQGGDDHHKPPKCKHQDGHGGDDNPGHGNGQAKGHDKHKCHISGEDDGDDHGHGDHDRGDHGSDSPGQSARHVE